MKKEQLVEYIRKQIKEALVGKIPGGVTVKHARTEEEALELEKDGFIRVDKRKPSFNYKDEKGSYIPMMKRGTA
jgi:hypothetical protein